MEDTNPQGPHPQQGKQKGNDEGSVANREVKKPGSKAQGRKRTKTGCLTCRKRRIKCGEERPICHNCTKSRRQCEGYNQRVVFKDPISTYRGPSGAVSLRVPSSAPNSNSNFGESSQKPLPAPSPLAIASGPTASSLTTFDALPASTTPVASDIKQNKTTTRQSPPRSTSQFDDNSDTTSSSRFSKPRTETSLQDEAVGSSKLARSIDQGSRDHLPKAPAPEDGPSWSGGPTTIATATSYASHAASSNWPRTSDSPELARTSFATHGAGHAGFSTETAEWTPQEHYDHSLGWDQEQVPGYPQAGIQEHQSPVPAPWELDNEDPFDISDEDHNGDDDLDNWQHLPHDSNTRNSDLGTIVALQAGYVNHDLTPRSITSFIDRPNMLASYRPSPLSSPLNDNMTARIFCHFINVIGPTMSMFERHPANPSLMFQGHPIPLSQQHIWTYTFPTLAFHNEGLLHAILAIASFHISLLQGSHITASLKHYAISLRRVGKSVSNHARRRQPATLASAMLLAYYECWGADHQKWSDHLLGASMLLKEIDFAGMTRYIKSMKLQQRHQEEMRNFPPSQRDFHPDMGRYERPGEDVDENLVAMLMGKRVRYDEHGQIIEDNIPDGGETRSYSQQELQDYETQRDLFWWYCKLDVYHSILGGSRLYTEYDRWSHCLPRAPLGRLNATYGTYDHLILLMGRVADFAAKDLKRKRLAMKANAGQRPPGTTTMPNQAGQGGPPMPPFSGMVPGTFEDKLPMGFQETFRDSSPKSQQDENIDLDAWRNEAEEEWQDIMNCFGILEDHFGEDFQALGPEFSTPIQTPFGPALQYRTYGIAGIWMNYYTALITCHRVHPSMPPAAMVAAGIAARQTASFANEIGRIAAGIAPDCSRTTEVSPGVGAGLIESSFCLFIAGVQYQNPAQRTWIISRLRDIARLTGWQSALSVVHGCEATWVKVAALGRGPPYTQSTEDQAAPNIGNDNRRIIDKEMDSVDRRLVVRESARARYALGLLGVEEDFDNLVLDEDNA